MRAGLIIAAALVASSQAARAETVLQCQFGKLQPMTLIFRGGMGATNNTLQVGDRSPVPLAQGSQFAVATVDQVGFTFWLRPPASVQLDAPGIRSRTFRGTCKRKTAARSKMIFFQDPFAGNCLAKCRGLIRRHHRSPNVTQAPYRVTPVFDEASLPEAIRTEHRIKAGTWGLLRVIDGAATLVFTEHLREIPVMPGQPALIPPTETHFVRTEGSVRLQVEFYREPPVMD